MRKINVTFVSNYINHHQIPFCESMCCLLEERGGNLTIIQTDPMEEERVKMGWSEEKGLLYVRRFYEVEEYCKRLIRESEVVLFGGCDDETYIEERLKNGMPVVRISERLYKTGQWKAISPRGLIKKYHDHTRYRRAPVFLLCAGGYVASDYHIVRAYPGKMYKWGYFPRTELYDVDRLIEGKGYGELPYILWAGRLIDWKHAELALETAEYLQNKNIAFHMDIIGGGDMEAGLREMLDRKGLSGSVKMAGFKTPGEVRRYMERADIFLFTSDRQEGWGAVLNEAMNSACAVVADHMIGAVPYLIRNEHNGIIYRDGDKQQLFKETERLVMEPGLRRELGENAYRTITEVWNPQNAAKRLLELLDGLLGDSGGQCGENYEDTYPCAPERAISEKRMYGRLIK